MVCKARYWADLENNIWSFFAKVDHSEVVLLELTWSGEMHALMDLRMSWLMKMTNGAILKKCKSAILFW